MVLLLRLLILYVICIVGFHFIVTYWNLYCCLCSVKLYVSVQRWLYMSGYLPLAGGSAGMPFV